MTKRLTEKSLSLYIMHTHNYIHVVGAWCVGVCGVRACVCVHTCVSVHVVCVCGRETERKSEPCMHACVRVWVQVCCICGRDSVFMRICLVACVCLYD